MGLGLGSKIQRGGGLITPGIITDNLVMKHNYSANGNIPVSDGAVYFDGNDYIAISHSAIDISTTDFTIAAWIMPITGAAQYDCIMAKRDGNNEGFQFDLREASYNSLGFALEDADSTITNAGTAGTVSLNIWQHACVTVDRGAAGNTGAYFYNDGVLDSDSTLTGAMSVITSGLEGEAPLVIGAKLTDGGVASNYWNGYICNVGFWNRVLTQAEIKSIMWKNYAGLTDTEKTNLVSWWNLDNLTNNKTSNWIAGMGNFHNGTGAGIVLDESNTTLGSNLISDAESSGDSWSYSASPYGDAESVITAPSTEQYKSSPNSIKLVPATADDGIISSGFATSTGKVYEVRFWAYVSLAVGSGTSGLRVKMYEGGGGTTAVNHANNGGSTDMNFEVTTANEWVEYSGYIIETNGGSDANLIITCGGYDPTGGAITYYFDDIKVREVVNAGVLV